LSPSIIEEAVKARPDLYDETKVGDVTEIFQEMKPIDLIIAADSYIYFGDLNPLFKAMSEGLNDNGIVAFTLENPPEEYEEK
jgi:predicted TPR repeat methyltransferase